ECSSCSASSCWLILAKFAARYFGSIGPLLGRAGEVCPQPATQSCVPRSYGPVTHTGKPLRGVWPTSCFRSREPADSLSRSAGDSSRHTESEGPMDLDLPDGVEITAPIHDGYQTVLTREALELIARLHR